MFPPTQRHTIITKYIKNNVQIFFVTYHVIELVQSIQNTFFTEIKDYKNIIEILHYTYMVEFYNIIYSIMQAGLGYQNLCYFT